MSDKKNQDKEDWGEIWDVAWPAEEIYRYSLALTRSAAAYEYLQKLANQQEMEAFLSEKGVDIATFRKAMKSFAVDNRVQRAATLFNKYLLRGVPAIVVGGRYASATVKNYEHLLLVTDHMIELAREEQRATD